MQERAFLLTMAEIAIAIVAFATIVIVLRQSIGSELTRLRVLAAHSPGSPPVGRVDSVSVGR